MSKSVYLSVPYSAHDLIVSRTKEVLQKISKDVKWYSKGAIYTDQPIKDCDIFCIILPDNAFKSDIDSLSMGIKKELNLAKSLNKTIILAYNSQMAGGIVLYLTEIKDGKINGIPSTNSDVIKLFKNETPEFGTEDQPKEEIKLKRRRYL